MSFAKSRAFRPGLRARLTLWTAAVLAMSLAAGFAWVHHGLRAVLEAKNDAFLVRKGAELVAVAREEGSGGDDALEAEIRREVAAYEAEGLIVVVRRPGRDLIAPDTAAAQRLADRLAATGWPAPSTTCSIGWRPITPRSRASRPTPRTSCAAPWGRSAPRSRWRSSSLGEPRNTARSWGRWANSATA